jgi:hypothetical protein
MFISVTLAGTRKNIIPCAVPQQKANVSILIQKRSLANFCCTLHKPLQTNVTFKKYL